MTGGLSPLSEFIFIFAQTKNQECKSCRFSSWEVGSQGVWAAKDLVVFVGARDEAGAD